MRKRSSPSWPDNFLKDYFSEISYDEITAHGRPIKTKRAKASAVHYVIENSRLTDKQKTALLLRYRSGLSLAQIGAEVGTDDRSMISQRIHRAVKKLVSEDNAKILKYGIPAESAAESAAKSSQPYVDSEPAAEENDDFELAEAVTEAAAESPEVIAEASDDADTAQDSVPRQIKEYRKREAALLSELEQVRAKIDELESRQMDKLLAVIEELGLTPEDLAGRLNR